MGQINPTLKDITVKVITKFGTIISIAAVLMATCGAMDAQAQGKDVWPSKPIRFVVPFAAGGSIDVLARLMGRHLETRLGQSIVVENRTGAGGAIGFTAIASAPPDGYTIGFVNTPNLLTIPIERKSSFTWYW